MPKNIIQKVVFKNTTPKILYNLYMNAKKHSAAIGAKVEITDKIGTDFTAHDGYITGRNIHLEKDFLILQTWRGTDWSAKDKDSMLLISFGKQGKDTLVILIHQGVPDKHHKDIDKGWHDYYWKPWRAYFAGKKVVKKEM